MSHHGDERDEIRRRIDIVALVGRDVALRKRGRSFSGLCPFHEDRNPSFTVNPDSGRYRCWSCGEHGDCFTWVMKRQNVDFVEALKLLAKEAGVELASRGPAPPPGLKEAQAAAMDLALRFFRDMLTKSAMATEYLKSRDLPSEIVEKWELGYGPASGQDLAARLGKAGFSLAMAQDLFLVDGDERGYHDRFRSRLIFPIRDERGTLVAFGGRIIGTGIPKYINSSDTPLYRKSRVLYGLHDSRDALAKSRRAVLCEGYVDVIASHRAGIDTAVASLGTALSQDHAKLLKRWADEVVILYDSDAAGQKAAQRASEILTAEGLRVRVAMMPEGEDPDSLLAKSGPQAVVEAVQNAIPPFEFALAMLERRAHPSTADFWTEALDLLAAAPDELSLVRQIDRYKSQMPGMRDDRAAEDAIRRELRARGRKDYSGRRRRAVAAPTQTVVESVMGAEAILFRAFLETAFRRQAWMFLRAPRLFASPVGRRLAHAISQAFPHAAPEGPPSLWLHEIEDESLLLVLEDLMGDLRAVGVSEAVLADAVEDLKRRAEKAARERMRTNAAADEDRSQIIDRIRRTKADPRIKTGRDEDEDFFA